MNRPLQAVILCGGKGSRLRPQIEEIPKTLVNLNGKPILEHNLELFSKKSYQEFVLCIGYMGGKIENHIKKLEFKGIDYKVEFSNVGIEASMLKRIYHLKEFVKDRILITYGDTLTNINVHDLQKEHIKSKKSLTIVITKIRNPFGLVNFNKKKEVLSFVEKPLLNYYIGMFIMNYSVFSSIEKDMIDKPDGEGLICLFKELINHNELMVYEYKGKQITFNTYTELSLAEEEFKSFYTL